ncbi:TraR/DksA family transcriptional regulator [bacterium]|nr:TraR/DksA family transcriptional regulator [bacterium]
MPNKKQTTTTTAAAKDYSRFAKLLNEKKARILKDVTQMAKEHLGNSQRESSGDLSTYSIHMADMGTDAAERETMLSLASSEQKLIQKVNHALERINQGTYGVCEICSGKIPDERLEALPEATICIKCMKKFDF